MASTSSITLNDGQTTPVAHVFNRMPSTNAAILPFRDATTALVVAAKPSVVGTYRPAASNNDGAKRTWNITVPEYDPVLKKTICTARIKIEYLLPDGCSAQTLKDVGAYLKNFANLAALQTEIVSSDPMV